MMPSAGARALNWACGATATVLVAAGLVAALITGFIAFILTAEGGFQFFAGLAWFVTAMCVLAPFLFLYVYDEWQKKKGLHE